MVSLSPDPLPLTPLPGTLLSIDFQNSHWVGPRKLSEIIVCLLGVNRQRKWDTLEGLKTREFEGGCELQD